MTERETTTNAMADEKTFTFYSSESKWVRRIKQFAEKYPDDVVIMAEDDISITAEISKKYFKIRPPRTMSDEQKQAAAERMQKMHEAKKNK